jgi:hypothetical protein
MLNKFNIRTVCQFRNLPLLAMFPLSVQNSYFHKYYTQPFVISTKESIKRVCENGWSGQLYPKIIIGYPAGRMIQVISDHTCSVLQHTWKTTSPHQAKKKNGDRSKIPQIPLQFERRSRGVPSVAKLYVPSMFCSRGRDTPRPKCKSEWSAPRNGYFSENRPSRSLKRGACSQRTK